ncbi:MAG: hypothetical protein NTW28_32095 [Candidatus Solibacter sp.]|nr:hypothetical protein [Candidatus Solibacter sp.]
MTIALPEARRSAIKGYSGVVLCSVAEIQSLQPLVRRSLPQIDNLVDPEFALASVSKGWLPRVAAVWHGSEFAGLVIAKERVLRGPRLGVVYADLTFGCTLLGDPLERQDAFLSALETLLAHPGTRGLRLRVPPHSPELAAVRELLSYGSLDVHFSRVKDHAALSLPGTYEQLLLSLGSTTRHNFRYYRRRFEAAGHVFLDSVPLDELRSAALYLEPKCSKPCGRDSTDRLFKMAASADRPLAVGLKHRNGQWLSVICGVYRPAAGVLLLQLNNDREFPRDSLSVVLRGYLMESLIRQRMKEFIIWAGTAPPLSRYVTYIPTVGVYLDSPEYKWRLARGVVSKVGPWLPRWLQLDARWIAPFSR